MIRRTGLETLAYAALVALGAIGVTVALQLVFLVAPEEARMGIVQKIFYFHVPSAIGMYVGAVACFLGSAAYLFGATEGRDALARAGAEVAVLFGTIVLVTGPLWASKAWGHAWTWEPRLTTSLLSFLIYLAYLVLRSFGGGSEAERKFAAALGFLGAVNLPIIHFSVRKWSGQHPRVIGEGGLRDPDMLLAFVVATTAFVLLAAALVWSRTRIGLAEARVARLEREAIQHGLEESAA